VHENRQTWFWTEQYLDVVEVGEDEGLLHVEAARDDVPGVLVGQPAVDSSTG
jgi:hypothetical protein